LDPNNAEFSFNLAVSLDHLGQTKLAAQYYQRAIQLDPSHSTGFNHSQIAQRIAELEQVP
jgi:Flp pilus assembly protein TadD